MIEVAHYIEHLLLQNDCVIVPGLGGFVAQDCEACYVKEENIFLPPYRSVSFNPRLTMNDGLFVTEVARAKGISYNEAFVVVNSGVNIIREQIAKRGLFNIPGVGCLKAATNGGYEFKPLVCGIDSPDHFGLDSIYIAPIKEIEAPVPALEVNTKTQNAVTLKIRKNVLRYTAAIAVAATFFFVCLAPLNLSLTGEPTEASVFQQIWEFVAQSTSSSSQKLATPTEAKPTSRATVNAQTVSDKVLAAGENAQTVSDKVLAAGENAQTASDKVQTAGENARMATEKTQSAAAENKPFTIVVASAVTQQGADYIVSSLRKKGLKDAAIVDEFNMIRVVYGRYAYSGEAAAVLAELRNIDEHFAHAWINKVE